MNIKGVVQKTKKGTEYCDNFLSQKFKIKV